jgi:alpha-ketoglutarate-dependent taurine dioxygenase
MIMPQFKEQIVKLKQHVNDLKFAKERIIEDGFVILEDAEPGNDDLILEIGSYLGNLNLNIDVELSGPKVMDIRVDPQKMKPAQRPSYYNSSLFSLHTDLSYVSNPPKYMIMQCIQPDPQGNGLTLLSDCRQAYEKLSLHSQKLLESSMYEYSELDQVWELE